ncbi:hypothetical protein B0T17DRAFT_189144 [Bombardia bombarda]|uniref:AB hydrolase-1 domain-containing protein n=1 Tax=Bombardia bombarda TaxID=252184 RepID=A0AA39X8Z4_9PEZI|nr:hypothetical protein B0T17DRAFT_189144 [Bombardia bombarda]
MFSPPLFVVLALGRIVAGAATTSFKQCVELNVSVPVVATNHFFIQPRVDSTIDAVDWQQNTTTWSTPSAKDRIISENHINQNFSIHAQLCIPSQKGLKAGILQLATHGLGFDKRYWDVQVQPEEYSYLDATIRAGYSFLSYDRLGTGLSEKPNAYDTVQLPTEIEILAGLTKLARSGQLISASTILSTTDVSNETDILNFKPTKTVHVGHAFGSYLMTLMLGRPGYGQLSDGALMTGLLFNTYLNVLDVKSFNHEFAKEYDPVLFANYTSGYFVLGSKTDLQKLFLRKTNFDPALLTYLNEIKQPETVGEYASESTTDVLPANDFKAPILFFAGEFDWFLCLGNCTGTYNEAMTRQVFPNAIDPTPYLQPNTGHANTLSLNASAGYQVMYNYLGNHGL